MKTNLSAIYSTHPALISPDQQRQVHIYKNNLQMRANVRYKLHHILEPRTKIIQEWGTVSSLYSAGNKR